MSENMNEMDGELVRLQKTTDGDWIGGESMKAISDRGELMEVVRVRDLEHGGTLYHLINRGGVPYSVIYRGGYEEMSCERSREGGMLKTWNEVNKEADT